MNTLRTNDKSESVLEGITRTSLLEVAEKLGYQTEIAPITVEDLFNAEEVFFTGTAAEVTPITKVTDSRDRTQPQDDWKTYEIGSGKPGEITLQLAKIYGEIVRGKNEAYDHWLTYVYDSPEEARRKLNGKVTEPEQISRY